MVCETLTNQDILQKLSSIIVYHAITKFAFIQFNHSLAAQVHDLQFSTLEFGYNYS